MPAPVRLLSRSQVRSLLHWPELIEATEEALAATAAGWTAATSLTPDTLVLAMGADSPGKRELGEGVLDDARLVADVPADAFRVGELAHLPSGADRPRAVALGDLLASHRELPGTGRIVFDSVGTAVADAAAVGLVIGSAERAGVGTLANLAG